MQDNNIIQNAINCIKRLHKENVELKAENERLKQEWRLDCLKCEHDKYNANENSLEGCLARLINNLWQDLTEEERKQIKEILE